MLTLLIVDDETEIADDVRTYFEEEGYRVFTADTAKEGLSLLGKLKPDLMLLDIKLPDMSGLTVLQKAKAVSPRTKVIVNTGYVDQMMMDEAERLGRDAFLHKPFNLLELRDEVEKILAS